MSLNQEQRTQAIELLRKGDLSNEEIAEVVGISPGSVIAIRANMSMGRYDDSSASAVAELLEDAGDLTFSLERDMQAALRLNIQQLEAGLAIADGGKERVTAAGRIDITAKSIDGTTVIIELKAGVASPQALTQVLAYVGAVGEEEGTTPRGLLVAQDFHPKVVFAAKATPNVRLLTYGFTFSFKPAS